MEKKTFTSTKNTRLSTHALELCEGLSYPIFMKSLRKKDVKVNGKRVSVDVILNVGDVVDVFYQERAKGRFDVIYQDQNVLVVDKKVGVTSEEVFLEVTNQFGEAYFIHRLDRNTTGLMVFALNKISETELLNGFKERTFIKKYIAEVYGVMDKKQDILTAYLKKNKEDSLVYISDSHGRDFVEIKTGYKVLKTTDKTSVLEVDLYTGKTHQIRAHLAHIGHFIIGDGKYGDNRINRGFKEKNQRLCAYKLTLKFNQSERLYYLNGKTFSTVCPFYSFK